MVVPATKSATRSVKDPDGKRSSKPARTATDKSKRKPGIDELASTQPLVTVKARLSEFVDRAVSTHDRITITRNGVPVAVLLSADDFESMTETLDIMSDPEAMTQIAEARADVEAGRVIDAAELRQRLEARR